MPTWGEILTELKQLEEQRDSKPDGTPKTPIKNQK